MEIESVLRDLVRRDILKMVYKRYHTIPISQLSRKVDQYITDNPPIFEVSLDTPGKRVNKVPPESDRCCARIWDHNRGTRCTHRRKLDSEHPEYCGTHNRELIKRGYLKFRRYDEERPEINAEGTRIPWYDTTPTETLQILLDYQGAYLKTCLKRPKITP